MTQEELEALVGDAADAEGVEEVESEDILDTDTVELEDGFAFEAPEDTSLNRRKGDGKFELPLPATNENKMVHQLDDVTKESEEKASEIFDIINGISEDLTDKEEDIEAIVSTLQSNIDLFSTLSQKFPEVHAFGEQLEKNQNTLDRANDIGNILQKSDDSILLAMDIMQYQDIHRQKIERVINVMRSLSNYMNTLFEGKIDDKDRVASANHIAGDDHNDLASADEIESLLEQFGN